MDFTLELLHVYTFSKLVNYRLLFFSSPFLPSFPFTHFLSKACYTFFVKLLNLQIKVY